MKLLKANKQSMLKKLTFSIDKEKHIPYNRRFRSIFDKIIWLEVGPIIFCVYVFYYCPFIICFLYSQLIVLPFVLLQMIRGEFPYMVEFDDDNKVVKIHYYKYTLFDTVREIDYQNISYTYGYPKRFYDAIDLQHALEFYDKKKVVTNIYKKSMIGWEEWQVEAMKEKLDEIIENRK